MKIEQIDPEEFLNQWIHYSNGEYSFIFNKNTEYSVKTEKITVNEIIHKYGDLLTKEQLKLIK